MLLCDTRERWTQHKRPPADSIGDWFLRHGVNYHVQKLDVGDYMIEGGSVTVDTKQDLEELSRNLMNKADRARFMKEVRRARDRGLHLVVLCRHGDDIQSIPDVAKWHSDFTCVSGRALMDEIYRVHIAYGVDFLFCDKESSAKKILEILK